MSSCVGFHVRCCWKIDNDDRGFHGTYTLFPLLVVVAIILVAVGGMISIDLLAYS